LQGIPTPIPPGISGWSPWSSIEDLC